MLGRDRYDFKGLTASAAWAGGAVTNGTQEAQDITVSGAAVGDYAQVSCSFDVVDLQIEAHVTAANTVTVLVRNGTGGDVTPSGTLYVKVEKRA